MQTEVDSNSASSWATAVTTWGRTPAPAAQSATSSRLPPKLLRGGAGASWVRVSSQTTNTPTSVVTNSNKQDAHSPPSASAPPLHPWKYGCGGAAQRPHRQHVDMSAPSTTTVIHSAPAKPLMNPWSRIAASPPVFPVISTSSTVGPIEENLLPLSLGSNIQRHPPTIAEGSRTTQLHPSTFPLEATTSSDQTVVPLADVSDKVHLITAGAETVAVYATDYSVCYRLRVADVKHLPIESKRWNQDLVLCKRYTGVDGSCPKGADCWFVHADVVGIPSHPVHVNYAWRQLADVTYERLPPGYRVLLLDPSGNEPHEVISSERVLRTTGAIVTAPGGSQTLCPSFYINRVCSRGPDCQRIHTVYIDAKAKNGQRAPAPQELLLMQQQQQQQHGRGRLAVMPKSAGTSTSKILVSSTVLSGLDLTRRSHLRLKDVGETAETVSMVGSSSCRSGGTEATGPPSWVVRSWTACLKDAESDTASNVASSRHEAVDRWCRDVPTDDPASPVLDTTSFTHSVLDEREELAGYCGEEDEFAGVGSSACDGRGGDGAVADSFHRVMHSFIPL